jgi:sorting nexin-29
MLSYLLKCLELFNTCWNIVYIPDEWREVVNSLMFNKDNRIECSNYTGVSLLNCSYKIYAKVLSNRVNEIEHILKEKLNGFRKGHTCKDFVFIITQLI